MSSRETGLERRIEMMTTSSHEEKTTKQQKKDRIHISFKSKDSKKNFFTGNKEDRAIKGSCKTAACDKNKKNHENDEAEALQDEDMDTWKAKGGSSSSSSKNSTQTQKRRDARKHKIHCPAKEHKVNEHK